MSANTDYYWKRIQETEANPVAAYQSKYQDKINQLEANPITYNSKYQVALDNILGQIQNRKAFSYDFNADPLYQSYKDTYTKLGKEASMNAVANAAALTGGYGNSYAVTAGAQANQQYLTELNNVIPKLYNMAMDRYRLEGDELNNRYNVIGSAEDRDYGKYRDQVADWKDQLAYLNEAEDRYYGKYRDQVADYNNLLAYLQGAYGTQLSNDQWRAELDEKIREFDLEYALKNRPLYGGGTTVVYRNGGGKGEKETKVKESSHLDNDLVRQMAGAYKASYLGIGDNLLNSMITDAVNNGDIKKKDAVEYYERAKQLSGAAY